MLRVFFRRYWLRYLVGFLFLVVSSWFTLLSPGYLGDIVDFLSLSPIDTQAVALGIRSMILVALGAFVTRFLWRNLLIGTSRDMECHLRSQLYDKFIKLPPSFYATRKTGDLMAYAINDINAIRMSFGPAMAQLLNGVFLSAVSIYRMVSFDSAPLVLVSLTPILIAAAIILILGSSIRRRFRRVQESFSAVSDQMQESITGIRVIKSFVQEEREIQRFQVLNERMRQVNMDMVRLSALLMPLIEICFGAGVALSLIVGSALVRRGQLSLGDLVAFQGYLTAILHPVMSIGRITNLYQRGMASWQRMSDILAQPDAPAGGQLPANARGAIRVQDLTFSYPHQKHAALSGVSFDIRPGEQIGIMGETGGGKSTLVDILLGLRFPPEGTVFIDGVPLESLSLPTLREAVGYVPQDDFLFSATVRENLWMFEEGEEEQMLQATRAAAIDPALAALPQGYDTRLGERGVNLSGGQRQRLAIARALLRHPQILILDDALSSVDTRTEADILEGLKAYTRRKTTLIVAHRVSTLRHCDRILVLNKGRLTESGTHEDLLKQNGYYARQYRMQSRDGEVGA